MRQFEDEPAAKGKVPLASTFPESLSQWVSDYASEARREESVDEFVKHVNASILELIPEIGADPVLVSELDASTRSQFRAFLNLLEHERQEVTLPPQAVDLALSIARRNMELGVLLKVYRVAQGAVWEFFTEVADSVPADGPDRGDILIYLWGRGGAWINEAIEYLIPVFYAEREASMHGALARRTETVQTILRGEVPNIDTASNELGHQLRAVQTGMVLWSEDAVDASLVPLNAVATSIASALGASTPLTLPGGRHELWAWFATRGVPDLAVARGVVSAAGAVRIASGTPAPGIEGFRRSHREALDTQRCVVSGGSAERFTAYDEVELVCLIAGHEDGARALVERQLGGLAGDDPALARIRETVRLYLGFGGNVDATAQALIVHKNTVRYRLAQAEEALGRPLTEGRTELDLALRYHERMLTPPR